MKDNRSVNRILSILELIAAHPEGLTLGQIYRELDIPKATAYDFLQTLYKADAIYYKDPRLKNYVIGSKMFAIGSVYTKNSSLIEASEMLLRNFANEYGKTVLITKQTEDHYVHIFKYQPPNSLIFISEEIGYISNDFDISPIGRAFKIFTQKRNKLEPNQLVEFDRGYVLSNEQQGHISQIAVPVKNFENRVVGILSVSDLWQDKPEKNEVILELVQIAKTVSKRLGYLGD
ncbi:helix-turn-helix domain-containing protein [Acholeplasma equirhinis]|uniref:IclR family transcriptional regulator n=1 Tax=Acholeplasma equirhinis TaxID=555393 RepID=UPI00197A97E2|nr:helix-turn-helix domain-containing protein [Acholeplasma equirhinis]MBN3490729.1 helix-turn-helix domain-containing protein [Acholeplasma equirhinis]